MDESSRSRPASRGRRADEADRLLFWIRGLVDDERRLEQRGASEAELQVVRQTIASLLWRLAAVVRAGGVPPRGAAA